MTTTSALQARTVAGLEVLHRPGTGPTVIALPGLGSSGWAWEGLAEALPEIDLYAISLAGRGGSEKVTYGPGLQGHAEAVARVAEALDLRDAVVIGHSMGAFLAPFVARQMPDRVKHLVLVDGGIRPKFPFFLGPRLTALTFRKQLGKLSGTFPDVEAVMKKGRVGPMVAQAPEVRPQLVRMLDRELGGVPGARVARTDVDRCVADAVDCFYGEGFAPALAALHVPAYVVLAENKQKAGQAPFIPDSVVGPAVAAQPNLHVTRIPGNHVTVVYADEVAKAVLA